MKKFLFFTFLVCIQTISSQEIFHVLHVNGEILVDSLEIPIKSGDEIIGNPKFKFSSDNDKAVLLSNIRGRVILFLNKEANEKDSEFYYYLKNNILPIKEYTATRGDSEGITFLFFKKNKLFLPKKIKVFKTPDSPDSYYLIEYNSKNKTFQDKVVTTKDGFIELNSKVMNIEKRGLTFNDIDKISLKYYDHKSKKHHEINSLILKSCRLSEIEKELNIYSRELKKSETDSEVINSRLAEFLQETYNSDIKLSDFEID